MYTTEGLILEHTKKFIKDFTISNTTINQSNSIHLKYPHVQNWKYADIIN